MVLFTLLTFLMINVIVIKVYSEPVERELEASMAQVADIDEEALEELLASFMIHKNESVLLLLIDGVSPESVVLLF